MDVRRLLRDVDVETVRAFVNAARRVIDAMLIEKNRIAETRTPAPRDYESATSARETPSGGWISQDELRQTARELAEAIAVENWVDGAASAIRLLGGIGGVAT